MNTIAVIAVTAAVTTAVILYTVPAVAAAADRRRWFIAVRRRRREIRMCTTKSLTYHSRVKYAQQVGRHRRAELAQLLAERWDERLTHAADTDNVDWLLPWWVPVIPIRERTPAPTRRNRQQRPARKARWAPPLTTTDARN